MRISTALATVILCLASPGDGLAQPASTSRAARGDELLADYFERETAQLAEASLAEIDSLEDWTSRRGEYQRQLREMLGLDPLPERSPLHAVVTGTVQHEDIVVERLHFQSMPGLYVTANLYRPKSQSGPLPAVLYACGHASVKKDGVSFGNKTHYQHHGGWFARSGYVCLVLDTIQLGEIEGEHHGTYHMNRWWWNNRGYTPAGVEAWNCVRALDYLQSREEVDADRLGMTGRSGGGAYSWWAAAIDERIEVVVPVAGITSLKNHVVDDCVEGHCDCMFMVNTYRWDFPLLAALIAPRPLLISNTDKDPIFPLDGVVDVHRKVRRIYDLYDAGDQLGLHITEGPHKDTQELRVHAFRWFNRFLKQDDSLVTHQAVSLFEPEQLRVFEELPADERVTTIADSFVPAVSASDLPATRSQLDAVKGDWIEALRSKTFRGWPAEESAEEVSCQRLTQQSRDGVAVNVMEFTSQPTYRLPIYVLEPESLQSQEPNAESASRGPLTVVVLDQAQWERVAAGLACVLPESFPNVHADPEQWESVRAAASSSRVAYVVPRGIGPTRWTDEERERTHIRRRFMLLGQTEAAMQVYDVRRAMQALEQSHARERRDLHGRGDAAVWALYASLFEPQIRHLHLTDLPLANRDAPDLLNVSRFVELPHVVLLAADRVDRLTIRGGKEREGQWRQTLSRSDANDNVWVGTNAGK